MEAQASVYDHAALPQSNEPVTLPGAELDTRDGHSREPGIDVDRLASSIGLSPETILELLRMFVDTSYNDLNGITDGIRTGNLQQVAESAHSLKGAALSFGLNEISSAARGIETGARREALSDPKEAIALIRLRLLAIERSIGVEVCQQA
ncbi:MAG: Hpt domain-containing protein [Syntrophobacteraceae bacterium]